MNRLFPAWIMYAERIACVFFIVWLQVVGFRTNSVVHHILHAAPIVLLLVLPSSPSRSFTGVLAGFAWVFMLGLVTPMLHNTFFRGYFFNRPEIAYTWLAPIAAMLAVLWAVFHVMILSKRPRLFLPGMLVGIGLTILFAWAHPYGSRAFEYPLDRTLDGEYVWAIVLLLETAIVLAGPTWFVLRLNLTLQVSRRFFLWQLAYWFFFVAAMVAGLLPVFNR